MSTSTSNKPDSEWRTILTPLQFRILREKGTEPPGSGEYDQTFTPGGVYGCAACGEPLYKSEHKFDSGCGWPAFFDAIPGKITRTEDPSLGYSRTEITCSNCGGHLGHVFKGENFGNPIDERHCVNSVSLSFKLEDGGQGEDENKGKEGKQDVAPPPVGASEA